MTALRHSPALYRHGRRHIYSSSASASHNRKVPLIYKYTADAPDNTLILQLYTWGRGASGQLGGGIEEIRLYPAPIASLLLPSSFRLSSSIPGRLPLSTPPPNHYGAAAAVEVGISCGLFHSALLVDGKLWIWGKGDGGRLGFGHENPAFVPTLNPNLDSVRSIALGGLHSVALDSLGQSKNLNLKQYEVLFKGRSKKKNDEEEHDKKDKRKNINRGSNNWWSVLAACGGGNLSIDGCAGLRVEIDCGVVEGVGKVAAVLATLIESCDGVLIEWEGAERMRRFASMVQIGSGAIEKVAVVQREEGRKLCGIWKGRNRIADTTKGAW
ncbi:hypothetical protein RJ640_028707 [Escallonia rubra]|uniref:Uncharacterized protein n=1 Tax=Escallonia rubra TaxID=112253 RepID=A0AA88RQ73_9ASTE|nr:hypothetical protein RJ640_028707 [Escallonia rubra]